MSEHSKPRRAPKSSEEPKSRIARPRPQPPSLMHPSSQVAPHSPQSSDASSIFNHQEPLLASWPSMRNRTTSWRDHAESTRPPSFSSPSYVAGSSATAPTSLNSRPGTIDSEQRTQADSHEYGAVSPRRGQQASWTSVVTRQIPYLPRSYPTEPSHSTVSPPTHTLNPSSNTASATLDISSRSSSRLLRNTHTIFETKPPSPPTPEIPSAPSRHQNRLPNPPVSEEKTLKSGLPASPNRSGWTLWVGNIPSNATEEELRHFFSARTGDVDAGIESVYLMTRSNCAFVNYHLERHLLFAASTCSGEPLRRADIRSKPLLCRIRPREDDEKSGVGAQRGTGVHRRYVLERSGGGPVDRDAVSPRLTATKRDEHSGSGSSSSSLFEEHFPKRFFILKALTADDLNESVKTGTWRTQVHNVPTLDQAYRTAKGGVFLVFSANRSGQWFGYARLNSPVESGNATGAVSNTLGSPFQIVWIRIKEVPFGKTRHLLNSFHSNREIKISRDGTEIDPATGEELLQMFESVGSREEKV